MFKLFNRKQENTTSHQRDQEVIEWMEAVMERLKRVETRLCKPMQAQGVPTHDETTTRYTAHRVKDKEK